MQEPRTLSKQLCFRYLGGIFKVVIELHDDISRLLKLGVQDGGSQRAPDAAHQSFAWRPLQVSHDVAIVLQQFAAQCIVPTIVLDL